MNIKNRRRVMFVIPRMGGGGAERVVANVANSLYDKGYEVKIVTLVSNHSFYSLRDGLILNSAMIAVDRSSRLNTYTSMARNFISAFYFIRNEIKKYEPDTVISMLVEADVLTHLVKMTGIKFRHICSERNDPSRRNNYIRKYLNHIYKNVDCFICQSKKVAAYYYKVPANKKVIIPNPIDVNLIPGAAEEGDSPKIVAVGRLDPQKNFSLLIDSFSDICEEFPDLTLTIFGEGPMRVVLEQKIISYGLDNKIFLPGSSKDVLNDIRDSSVFVMSSNFEGFPNSLIEAMAVGIPVISTDFDTGVAHELVENDNGIVVPVNNRDAMAKAIRKILSDIQLRKKMRAENRKIIHKLNLEKIVLKWEEII